MRREVAEKVLDAYPMKKLNGAMARTIVHAWAQASGWEQDRWGNYHPAPGRRIKLTKQRVQRQEKRGGSWRNRASTPLIGAAQNLVKKAAEALGDQEALAKVEGAQAKRRGAKEKRRTKAEEEARKKQVEDMASKVVSMERPMGFVSMYEGGEPSADFKRRWTDLANQIGYLQEIGRMPVDQDFFRTVHPPLAPVLIESEAEWVEEVDGVPYTVTLRHGDVDRAVIELGSIGSMGVQNRVDPITKAAIPSFEHREGDSYVSGYVQRRRGKDPVALLFFIQSQNKQAGAGSRVLDLWCNLMDSFGVDVWLAEAVGDEGRAFLQAKVRAHRLEILGERGANLVVRCAGGYRGRQQPLPFVKNPADVYAFPERPERVQVGSRSYALSDVGVPIKLSPEDIAELEDMEEPSMGDGPRVIDAGGNRWRYIWVYEPQSDRLESYRYSDGEWKVLSSRDEFPETFRKLQASGQLNTVSPEELEEFEQAMRARSDEALSSLQEWWEDEKGDQQRLVDALVLDFYEQQVKPEVERAWADIDRGVFPFDFVYNERIGEHESREDQARMHALHQAMKRTGFTREEDAAVERFVIRSLALDSWEDLDDQQSIEWALSDVLYQRIYPTVKRGARRRGYVP
jgi:hypothetical protein